MNTQIGFDWIPFYTEFSNILVRYQDKRNELIQKLSEVYASIDGQMPSLGETGTPKDIDPFTTFGLFNRGLTVAKRVRFLTALKTVFDISSNVPSSYDGIPVLNPQSANYCYGEDKRGSNDVQNLWNVFLSAIAYADNPTADNKADLAKYYDIAIRQKNVKWNLSMGLFWIRPNMFVNLDSVNRTYLENICPDIVEGKVKVTSRPFSSNDYFNIVDLIQKGLQSGKHSFSSIPELSHLAFLESEEGKEQEPKNGWLPTLKRYNPNLTKEDWLRFLKEVEIPKHPSPMKMLRAMMELGGEASCKQLSETYGGMPQRYVGCIVNFGIRAKKFFSLPAFVVDGCECFYAISCLGKKQKGEDYFKYRIRSELVEALNEIDLSAFDPYAWDIEEENYWFISTDPDVFSFTTLQNDETISFSLYNEKGNKRRLFSHFLAVKEGDPVICYESTPTKKIVAIGEIAKASDGKEILVRKTADFTKPIDFLQLKTSELMQNSEFMKNVNGTLFRLTKDEFDYIMAFNNPSVESKQEKQTAIYTKEDFLSEVYMSETQYETLIRLTKNKLNVILQGAPGVGKTYTAKKLAYAMMQARDDERIKLIQFHQNYSYEDFILGYKPNGEGFQLTEGVFYQFCEKARKDPTRDYFFIIDEVNRGNMSKIFGELMMLIEKVYRGTEIVLPYNQKPFSVPKRLHIIGMMNTADRSLAMIDYALRRRFSFYEMEPGFTSEGFTSYMEKLHNDTFNKLIKEIQHLNEDIIKDDSLGRGFQIGHSYFCECTEKECTIEWMREIVSYDILPTLREYWFDNDSKYQHWKNVLIEVLSS